jgi:hypothetical protein
MRIAEIDIPMKIHRNQEPRAKGYFLGESDEENENIDWIFICSGG